MTMSSLSLVLAAAVAAADAPGRPAALANTVEVTEHDWTAPPPGTPEDQQLWREVREGAGMATVHMARVAQCAYRIRYGQYYEALGERARTDAAGAKGAHEKLAAAAERAQQAIPENPRVFACRHVLLDFEQRMDLLSDPKYAADMKGIREEARDCAKRVSAIVATVGPAADGLEAALVNVDTFLGRATPHAPAGGRAGPADAAGTALEEASR